jgi:hypothetical protein
VPAGAVPRVSGLALGRHAPVRLERERPLRGPRGVGGLLDQALDVLVERFGPCVGIGILCWLPLQLAVELASRSGASPEAQLVVQALLMVLALVPKFLTTAFVCLVVAGRLLERPVATADAVRRGFLRLPGLACLLGLQMLGMLLLACACLVPALLAPWLFALMPTLYVLEDARRPEAPAGLLARWGRGVRQAFERGLRLVLGWDSLGRFFGYSVVAYVTVSLPLSSFVGGLGLPPVREELDALLGLSGTPVDLALTLMATALVAVGTAYVAVLDAVFYFDQRVRREGLDLELALGRLESADGGGA